MDRGTAELYRERWRPVADLERQEQRSATDAERWRQFLQILAFSRMLEMQPPPDDPTTVRERWRLLKDRYARSGRH